MRKIVSRGLLLGLVHVLGCADDMSPDVETPREMDMDDVSEEQPEAEDPAEALAKTFKIRLENATQYLHAQAYDTPEGATDKGPLESVGQKYVVRFAAVPGSHLSFASMSATTNDWFFTFGEAGLALFDDTGAPVTGDVSSMVRLYDAGTEEEDPTTAASVSGGKDLGSPDDDSEVRRQAEDVTDVIRVSLAYSTGFELTIERLGDAVITPGLLLVHARESPLFESTQPDRDQGLEKLAESGDPSELLAWLTEQGSGSAPLRLSVSLTPFSPGVAYVFQGQNPLFTQGQPRSADTGLENLAEDGDNSKVYSYLTNGGYTAVQSAGTGLPGDALEFELEAKPGDMLNVAAMFVQSNDWFFSFPEEGVPLFESDGTPRTGTALSARMYVWDAGSELDEPVGLGANQAPRQPAVGSGADDEDELVRRVMSIDGAQFGKDAVASEPGVAALEDERGGYNLTRVVVELVD